MTAVSHLHDRLLREFLPDAGHRLLLDFSGCIIEVLSNAEELVHRLREYFRDFLAAAEGAEAAAIRITALETPPQLPVALGLDMQLKPREPGKQIKEEFANLQDGRVVHKRLTGMLFLFGHGRHLAVGPCIENDNQIVNFINNRFIEWTLDQGALLFHAAGVALPREGGLRGLALAGFAGMGKSTLALRIMRHQGVFVSNDRLMVRRTDQGLTMYGVAKMPRINPGTVLNNPDLAPVIPEQERRAYEALPPDELWSLERKYDAFIDRCFGPGRFRLSAPMHGLVLLNWKRPHEAAGEPLQVTPVDLRQRPDLLPAFIKNVGLFYRGGPQDAQPDFSDASYIDLLTGCSVYELTGSADFDAAAAACLELV